MLKRSAVMLVVLAAIVGGVWIQQAMAQGAPGGGPGGGPGGRDPAQMQQRMEQFRQQMSDRMKQTFGVTDEEWKVLQPKIEKVQTLARQTRGGGGGAMGGRRGGGPGGQGGPGGGGNAQPSDRPQTEVEKSAGTLSKVLENKDAKPEEIKAALTSLREARAKAKQELETAQKELREVLTIRQEAQCVQMGLLD